MASAPRSYWSWLEILVPIGVGLMMLVFTYLGWQYSVDLTEQNSRISFQNRTEDIATALTKRFDIYKNVLYDARGFYASSDEVTRAEWKTYIQNVGIGRRNVGITSLTVLQRVDNDNKTNFIRNVRVDGAASESAYLKSFEIFPAGSKTTYFPVVYVEPQSSTSAQVIGFDHSSNPIRNEALELARDTGEPHISGTTQSITTRQNVFLMYIPLYSDRTVPAEVSRRQQNLIGYISAGFANQNIFPNIIADSNNTNVFTIRFYDGDKVDPERLLYEQIIEQPTDTQLQTRIQQLEIAGRTWTIASEAPLGFGLSQSEQGVPNTILAGGCLVSLLLAACTYLLVTSRRRAVNLAEKITNDLQASEEKYRVIFETLQDVYYRTDLDGKIITVSPSIEKYFGLTPEQVVGKSINEFYQNPEEYQKLSQSLAQNGSVHDFEMRLKKQNGSDILMSVTGKLILDDNHQPSGFEGLLRDITERKMTEDEMRKQKNELEEFNRLMVDRELKMIDLKKEISQLKPPDKTTS